MNSSYVYYAHSMRKYNTQVERDEFDTITAKFDYPIINPNGAVNQNQSGEAAMRQCLDLVRRSKALVFTVLSHKWIGRGVYTEILEARNAKIDVFLLLDGQFYSTFDIKADGPTWALYATVSNAGRRKTIREWLRL